MMKRLMLVLAILCCSLPLWAVDGLGPRGNLDTCEPSDLYFDGSGSLPQFGCWTLCDGVQRKIYVLSGHQNYIPIVSVTPGCNPENSDCEERCDAATDGDFVTGWYYMDNHWCRDAVGNGCVCVTLEGFQYECNPSDTYFDGNGSLPQYNCWSLCEGIQRKIYVIPGQADREPIVSITLGCSPFNSGCNEDCSAATYWDFTTGWYFMDDHWCRDVVANGCICVTLDGYLAVELQSFTATAGDQRVDLNWATASEQRNDRFELLRDGVLLAEVDAAAGSTGHRYHYADESVMNGRTYRYTLVAVDVNGHRDELRSESATPSANLAVTDGYELLQNYPNPFNPTTEIQFSLAEAGQTTLTVFDLLGKEVAVPVNGELVAGAHKVAFDAAALPAGMYFYRLEAGAFVSTKKMMLVK